MDKLYYCVVVTHWINFTSVDLKVDIVIASFLADLINVVKVPSLAIPSKFVVEIEVKSLAIITKTNLKWELHR